MRADLHDVEWEPCLLEPRPEPEISRHVRKALGFVPGHVHYFTPAPWVARSFTRYDATQVPLYIERDLAQLIALVVAQDNSCRFCYAATRVMLRLFGLGEDAIRTLDQDLAAADLTPQVRAALEFARRVSRANPLQRPAALAPLRAAGFDDAAVREIVYEVGLNVMANRLTTLAAVPVEQLERLPERRFFPLVRPLAAILARATARRRVQPVPRVPPVSGSAFGELIDAFGELPLGPLLGELIDEAWRSEILPRRAKALVVGVVGRALDCPLSERVARRLLAAEGFPDDATDEVLATLTSPALSDVEAAIVPFVRETVRYVPAQIQRHGQAVRDRIGREAFVELLGWASLTNALCRMGAVLLEA